MSKFLKDGYQGMEIISHCKLCYLKDRYEVIWGAIYDELVKQHLIRIDTQENREAFLRGYTNDFGDLIFRVHSDGIGGNPMTKIILNLNKPYLEKTIEGKKAVLVIHRELPKGVNFLSQII